MRFGMGELLSQVLTQLSGREEPKLQKVLQDGEIIVYTKEVLKREICASSNKASYLYRLCASPWIVSA